MFGISFWEMVLIGLVALVFVGPDKLPGVLGTLGRWSYKLRRITTEVRHQTGIDDLLRQHGIRGGLDEIHQLRSMVKGSVAGLAGKALSPPAPAALVSKAATPSSPTPAAPPDIYADIPSDRSREYPLEGCDAYGCLPDDLWTDPDKEAFEAETKSIQERLSHAGGDGHEPSEPQAMTAPSDDPQSAEAPASSDSSAEPPPAVPAASQPAATTASAEPPPAASEADRGPGRSESSEPPATDPLQDTVTPRSDEEPETVIAATRQKQSGVGVAVDEKAPSLGSDQKQPGSGVVDG